MSEGGNLNFQLLCTTAYSKLSRKRYTNFHDNFLIKRIGDQRGMIILIVAENALRSDPHCPRWIPSFWRHLYFQIIRIFCYIIDIKSRVFSLSHTPGKNVEQLVRTQLQLHHLLPPRELGQQEGGGHSNRAAQHGEATGRGTSSGGGEDRCGLGVLL